MIIKSYIGKTVDIEAVKKYNEAQIWTAVLKDGSVISGTLTELRAYGKTGKQEPEPSNPGAN